MEAVLSTAPAPLAKVLFVPLSGEDTALTLHRIRMVDVRSAPVSESAARFCARQNLVKSKESLGYELYTTVLTEAYDDEGADVFLFNATAALDIQLLPLITELRRMGKVLVLASVSDDASLVSVAPLLVEKMDVILPVWNAHVTFPEKVLAMLNTLG